MSDPHDDEIRRLAVAIHRDRVRAARAMPPEQKLLDGARLFDEVCDRMRWGIRSQFPDADEAAVERELRRRLDLSRALENRT